MKIALVLMPELKRLVPSLGIAYLVSHLIKAGHSVSRHELSLRFSNNEWIKFMNIVNTDYSITQRIIDGSFIPDQKLSAYIRYCVKTITKEEPDIVGFSVFWRNLNICALVAKELKKTKIKVIFGGPETILNPDIGLYIENRVADYILQGEAEHSLPLLLDNLDKPDIPGIMFRQDNELKYTGKWIPGNINNLEFPVFDKQDINNSTLPWVLPITASRGCENKCDFCVHPKLWQIFRQRTPEDVVNEIKHQIKSHNIRSFMFNDSLLNKSIKFLKNFCRLVLREDLDIRWFGNARADKRLNESLFKLMYKAGCRCLFFGLESGSDKVLNDMNKGITTKLFRKNIKDAHKNKIWIKINLITGYPTETHCEFMKSIEFIARNEKYIDSFMVRLLGIPKKTDLYLKKGVHSIDIKTAEKRNNLIESIFKHQKDFPYKIFLEDSEIDYKNTTKKKFNSEIGIDEEQLKFIMP